MAFAYKTWANSWGTSWAGSWGAGAVVTTPGTGQTPAGSSKGRARRHDNRRRILLPDGTLIWATFDEAYEIIQASTKPVSVPTGANRAVRRQAKQPIRREEIRWEPVPDASTHTVRPLLPPRFTFQPTSEQYIAAIVAMHRRLDDEEAITLLML